MDNLSLTVELNENVRADIVVWFSCIQRGHNGGEFEAPEGPEFGVDDIEIERIFNSSYSRDALELDESGWYDVALGGAEVCVERYPDLYELMYDSHSGALR